MGIFLSSPLWMNKTIKIENKPVFYEDWFRKGICFVNDIMSEDGKFLSIDQLEEKFNISKNIMKFNSIISAVKHAGKQNVYNSYKLLTPFIPSFVKTILKSKRGTKDMYLLLIRNQRLSRACIVHLVIKKNNWSYVKTMYCSGSHLGITINIKNTKFVKDLPMIDAQFRFNQCNSFREEYISVFSPYGSVLIL